VKGEVGRTFKGEIDMSILTSASLGIQPQSFLDNGLKVFRNIARYIVCGILNRKLANTPNRMLSNSSNAINSSSYGNLVFLVGLTKMEIAGVEQKTAQ